MRIRYKASGIRMGFLILCIWFWTLNSFAQQKNLPLNREWGLNPEKNFSKEDSNGFSNFRPLVEKSKMTLNDYTRSNRGEMARLYTYGNGPWLYRKLKTESLIIVNDTADKFHLTIDPLLNFEFGKDLASTDSAPEMLYKNTRGILVRGDIGQKFSFESAFLENQATFVQYIDDYINSTSTHFPSAINYHYNVIPGQGRSKPFKKNGYDFAMSSGYVSYSPNRHFNFQLGTGKHFIGDGYRSLLLSDNAFNYPFARITTSFGKFQYTNLYAVFMNLTDGGVKTPPGTERLFQKKAASFQLLSWNVHKRIQLGLFQGYITESADSSNKMNLHLTYVNPIILCNALYYGLKNENNILLGATLKIKATNAISFYGQYMMDDISSANSLHNKTGFQAGVKYFDVLGIKNLHLQLEYNQVRPYSYASEKNSQSYTHYNQPLAHPLEANFREAIAFLNYRIGDFFTEVKFSWAAIGKDYLGNFGNNIFLSDTLNTPKTNNISLLDGYKSTLMYKDFKIGYLINPSTNLNIVAGISIRSEAKDSGGILTHSETNFIYFGIRTSLSNVYYDF